MDKKYLREIWNSVWEEGLTELEVQQRYYKELSKKLKGEDRRYLLNVSKIIEDLELEEDYIDYVPFENKDIIDEDEENIGCQTGERPDQDDEQLDFNY